MTIYWLIIALALISDVFCQIFPYVIYKKFTVIVFFVIITFISAIRVGIGTDYHVYEIFFARIKNSEGQTLSIEQGFKAFLGLLVNLGFTDRAMFVVSSIFTLSSFLYFIVRFVDYKFWGFASFLFICAGFYFNSLNLLRQFMAISFSIFAFSAFTKRQYKGMVCFFLAALLFHTSAFVILLLPALVLVLLRDDRSKWLTLIFAISIILSISGISSFISSIAMLNSHWAGYADGTVNGQFFTDRNTSAAFKIVIPLLIVLLGLYQDERKKPKEDDSSKTITEHAILAGALIYVLLQIIGYGIQPIYRLGLYFSPYFVAYTCHVVGSGKKESEHILHFALLVYFIILTYVTVFLKNGSGVIPYSSIFGNTP